MIPPMQNGADQWQTYLTRRDAALNMARFYRIDVQPTLFGEMSVIRDWGRIGTRGQTMTNTFDQRDDAVAQAILLQRQKRQRGYF